MPAKHRRRGRHGKRLGVTVLAAVTVSAVIAGTVALVDRFPADPAGTATAAAATQLPPAPPAAPAAQRASATPGKLATQEGTTTRGQQAPTSPAHAPVAVPLHVVGTAPDGTAPVSGASAVVVTFDEEIAPTSATPVITPEIAGHWSRPTPTTLRFDPEVAFAPDTTVTVVVPSGLRAANGGRLGQQTTVSYHVADGSVLRLQQLLAELHYLPVTFTAAAPETNTAAAQGAMAFDPPPGDFEMRFSSTPQALAALWKPGAATAVTTGAVMAFEDVHGLDIDGVAGPAVWRALLRDAVAGAIDPRPYTWAWTTMTRPETLQIWRDGEFVFSSKANTGIAAAPTPKGSWPVFSRFRTQTMQGTNPDGTRYDDPGVPYISYFNGGDAIHGFKRASYGSPQSLGCIELPYAAAARVWDLIGYGTVVTVSS